jgi:hypothetical protein
MADLLGSYIAAKEEMTRIDGNGGDVQRVKDDKTYGGNCIGDVTLSSADDPMRSRDRSRSRDRIACRGDYRGNFTSNIARDRVNSMKRGRKKGFIF